MGKSYAYAVERAAELKSLRSKRDILAADRTNDRATVNALLTKLDAEIRNIERDLEDCPNAPRFGQSADAGSYEARGAGGAAWTGHRHFATAGEQFAAIAKAGVPGNAPDPRLFAVRAAAGGNEEIPSQGGFLLQQDFSNEILSNVFAVGGILALCRHIRLSGNSNSIEIPGLDETSRVSGSRNGGVQSGYIAEAGEISASRPTFRMLKLVLKKLGVLVYVTDELLADVMVLQDVLTRLSSDELTFSLEEGIINGTGAGQPLGVLNSGALVTVSKESGQSAKTLLLENVQKMWQRMIGNSRKNAVWLINQDVEQQLYSMSLSIGTGGAPVFMPGGGVSAQPYMTLMGRPIITCEHCPTLGTVGDIILADFVNGYVLAEKGGVQAASSIHVLFSSDQSVFRFVMRVDGAPVLSRAVTPFAGTNTQSHFVALETRA